MIFSLEPIFVSAPSCASVRIWGDEDSVLSRESFALEPEETSGLEREVTATEPEAPKCFVLTTWEDHGTPAERQAVRRQVRQARQTQRPAVDLHLRAVSLIELLTSYFVLLGGGAMRGKAAHAVLCQFPLFATRGKPGPLFTWPRFRGFFLYSARGPRTARALLTTF